MFIGARIIKTGLAITLTIFICKYLHVEAVLFATATAAVNMQPTVNKSIRNAWEQVAVHVIGIIIAVGFGLTLGTGPFIIGLAVIVMLTITTSLKLAQNLDLGALAVILILESSPDHFLADVQLHASAIFIGLGVALLVNRILAPPKFKKQLNEELYTIFQETSIYFLGSLNSFVNSHSLESYTLREPVELKAKLERVMQTYEHAREEFTEKDNPLFFERMLEVNRGFIERGMSINEMTCQRVKRRLAPDSPLQIREVSPEFTQVLHALSVGETRLAQLVRDMVNGMREGLYFGSYEDCDEYWMMFDQALDEWQTTVKGVFYLRALMEISVVATEMRWAHRRMRSLHEIRSNHKA
ncbi:protein of unknown function DUF939 [Syntrophobotulus glycolicus DSM 8271]|uniref:Uncharacterized protein n=1 Tax=Syntrophobotulus glycolicus (strain DSM 8271 / FlGlyR) TaxID=645991 RepID=F0T101_SYNGF|nr:aromatic acid exporter family protein [Syntrophobotulus glycolicus]ADY57372.1 protein of unknown function DUF939 [Syntrophobotulus glycolicus DSM 8271]